MDSPPHSSLFFLSLSLAILASWRFHLPVLANGVPKNPQSNPPLRADPATPTRKVDIPRSIG